MSHVRIRQDMCVCVCVSVVRMYVCVYIMYVCMYVRLFSVCVFLESWDLLGVFLL